MKHLLASAALMIVAVAGSACTVTFDGVNGAGNPALATLSVTEQGQTVVFRLLGVSGEQPFNVIGNPSLCPFGGCVSNGTVYIMETQSVITMERAGGGSFTLASFQVAQAFNDDAAAAAGGRPNATSVDVMGRGLFGPVTAVCPVPTSGFEQCTLPAAFADVSLAFFVADGSVAIDSISYVPLGGPPTVAAEDGFEFTLAPRQPGPPDPASRN
jgi:hypothetical protein